MSTALDILAAAFLITGAFLALSASIGVLRFPDTLSRMHAATKPQVVGLFCVMVGAAIRIRSSVDVWMLLLIVLFQFLTAPVAAHLVGRLAYRTNNLKREITAHDDLERLQR